MMSNNCVDPLTFSFVRVSESEDLEMSESDAAKLVANIEMEMFDVFRTTDSKYMNKYRTIMFNLKDPKNKVGLKPGQIDGWFNLCLLP